MVNKKNIESKEPKTETMSSIFHINNYRVFRKTSYSFALFLGRPRKL